MFALGCGAQPEEPGGGGTKAGGLGASTFEIDKTAGGAFIANLVVDATKDWANIAPLSIGDESAVAKADDNAFGGGTSDDDGVAKIVDNSIPPEKDNLTKFYFASETVAGHQFIYLSWQRTNDNGTANMSFELNQNVPPAVPAAGGTWNIGRTAGDILVHFDWDAGANKINLSYSRWITTGTKDQCEANPKLPCWGDKIMLGGTVADASVNNTNTAIDPIPNPDVSLPPKHFGEAAIDLTAAGITGCFPSVFLKSRSSAAFNAELKDFIPPQSTFLCGTVSLKKVDGDGANLGNVGLQLWKDGGSGGGGTLEALDAGCLDSNAATVCTDVLQTADAGGTTCTTAASDGIGTCIYTITSSGFYIGHEVAPPAGYQQAADVGQNITLGATLTLTLTDNLAPGRINVKKEDDAGNPVAGAVFSLYEGNCPASGTAVATCTTIANGTCSFFPVDLGDYCVKETTVPIGYFAPSVIEADVTIGLGSNPNEGQTVTLPTFVNPRKFKVLVVVCEESHDLIANPYGTLYSSNVTLDGSTKASTATGSANTLCNIPGAVYTPLRAAPDASNPHQCSVDIGITPVP